MLPPRVDLGGLVLVVPDVGPAARRLAGDGVVASVLVGRTELHATREGVPRLVDGRIRIDPVVVDDVPWSTTIHGDVRVGGGIGPGIRLLATGSVAVEGLVERATVLAGGGLDLPGRVVHAELHSGHLATLEADLAGVLTGVPEALTRVADVALVAGEDVVRAQAAIDRMLEGPEAGLLVRVAAAEGRIREVLAAWPGVHETLAAAVTAARRALGGAAVIDDPARTLLESAAVIRAATATRRRAGSPVRIGQMEHSALESDGTLVVAGRGIVDGDVRVRGDLLATRPGSEILAGRIVAGGRVRASRLGVLHHHPLHVVLEHAHPGEETLHADFVDAGVVIDMGGERFTFARDTRDVSVVMEPSGPRLVSEHESPRGPGHGFRASPHRRHR